MKVRPGMNPERPFMGIRSALETGGSGGPGCFPHIPVSRAAVPLPLKP